MNDEGITIIVGAILVPLGLVACVVLLMAGANGFKPPEADKKTKIESTFKGCYK